MKLTGFVLFIRNSMVNHNMYKVTYPALFVSTLLLVPFLIFILWISSNDQGTDVQSESSLESDGFVSHGFIHSERLPELIKSEAIVIGTLGPVIAIDYPLQYQLHLNDFSDWSTNDLDEWTYSVREFYHRLEIEEIIKGDPDIPFVLGYPDTTNQESMPDIDNHNKAEVLPLIEGQRVVIFANKDRTPWLSTNKLEAFYVALPNNGILDIDERNRAFPRTPEMFDELTTDEGYYIGGDELQPYFDLDKLKLTIERMISEQEGSIERP